MLYVRPTFAIQITIHGLDVNVRKMFILLVFAQK